MLKTALPSNIQSFSPEMCFEILNLSNYLTAIDRSSVTEHCTYFDRDFRLFDSKKPIKLAYMSHHSSRDFQKKYFIEKTKDFVF